MKFVVEAISPVVAESYLSTSKGNRKISDTTLNTYIRDMLAGKWIVSPHPIVFDEEGVLIDGHHRLLAVCKSKLTLEFSVVRNASHDTMRVIDSGRHRSAADFLTISGVQNGSRLATAARLLYGIKVANFSVKLSTSEIEVILNNHPRLNEYVEACSGAKGINKSHLIAVSYLGGVLGESQSTSMQFIDVFKTGIPRYQNDPAHVLRERNISLGNGSGIAVQGRSLDARLDIYNLINSWNNFTVGNRIKKFMPVRGITYITNVNYDDI